MVNVIKEYYLITLAGYVLDGSKVSLKGLFTDFTLGVHGTFFSPAQKCGLLKAYLIYSIPSGRYG